MVCSLWQRHRRRRVSFAGGVCIASDHTRRVCNWRCRARWSCRRDCCGRIEFSGVAEGITAGDSGEKLGFVAEAWWAASAVGGQRPRARWPPPVGETGRRRRFSGATAVRSQLARTSRHLWSGAGQTGAVPAVGIAAVRAHSGAARMSCCGNFDLEDEMVFNSGKAVELKRMRKTVAGRYPFSVLRVESGANGSECGPEQEGEW